MRCDYKPLDFDHKIASLCDYDTKWRKGGGIGIRKWLESVRAVPLTDPTVPDHKLHAVFQDGDAGMNLSYVGPREPWKDARLGWSMFGIKPSKDGWIYGQLIDLSGVLNSDRVRAYVYNDFQTSILGVFHGLALVKGNAGRIKAHRQGTIHF